MAKQAKKAAKLRKGKKLEDQKPLRDMQFVHHVDKPSPVVFINPEPGKH